MEPLTGVTTSPLDGVQFKFDIMHELLASANSFSLSVNPDNRLSEGEIQRTLSTAQRAGISIHLEYVNEEHFFAWYFARLSASQIQGVLIAADEFFESKSALLGALSVQCSVATVYGHRGFVSGGGLGGLRGNPAETFHQLGAYVGLVLKGAKPAELPVYRVSRPECLLNVKTARLLKIAVPSCILNRAYDVLQ